ncbi:MAG: thioredoxin domain-containing protein, partial [Halobacteriales archaeon]|nr:thioredoxin domain-containing protein [Halobacteriales archaeon]
RWSWQAASAARAVQDTVDDEAFFSYAHRLYERQGQYSLSVIGEQAEAVGADPDTVRQAADKETYRPVLEADRELGTQLDLQGTPQVYVNGTRIDGYGYETVAAAIESQL